MITYKATMTSSIHSILAILQLVLVMAELPVHHSDQIVFPGDTVRIACSTRLNSSVHWKYRSVGSEKRAYIYRGVFGLDEVYRNENRLKIDDRLVGQYDLVIASVVISDAGTYTCIDNEGLDVDTASETQLIILDSSPACSHNLSRYTNQLIGENTCGLEPDYIRLDCVLSYRGNEAPILEWHHQDRGDIFGSGIVSQTSESSTMTSVILTASRQLDLSKFLCRVKHGSAKQCRLDPTRINVLYAINSTQSVQIETKGGLVSCLANTNFRHCIYTWINIATNKLVETGSDLELHTHGTYRCVALCSFSNTICRINALKVEYTGHLSTDFKILLALLVLICCAVIAATLFFVLRSKKLLLRERPNVARELDSINVSNCNDVVDPETALPDVIHDEPTAMPVNVDKRNEDQLQRMNSEKHLIISSGVVNTDLNLMGLTWLHNKIYLVFSKYTNILIFSGAPPFRQQMNDDIVLPQLDEPDDVTSCSACQSVFVSDYSSKNKCFWRIQMPERRVTCHSVQGKPSKLSVTFNDELLVIVRGENRAFLAVYKSSDGSYLRNVDFSNEIGKPVRACESASGSLIVLHDVGLDVNNKKKYSVSELMGSQTRSFSVSSKVTESSNMTPMPSHLAVGEDGIIFIADTDHARVLVLDQTSERCETFLMVDQPYRLCYVPEKQWLLVGKWSPGSFAIYGLCTSK